MLCHGISGYGHNRDILQNETVYDYRNDKYSKEHIILTLSKNLQMSLTSS